MLTDRSDVLTISTFSVHPTPVVNMLDYDLPPYPILHATNSSTFHLPPLDGSLTLPELYEWHLTNSPDHPFFVFAESTGNVKTIVWREISLAIRRGARFVKSHVSGHGSVAAPIVAILAHSGMPLTIIC